MIDYHLSHVYRVKVVIRPLRLVLLHQNHVEPPRMAEAPNWTRRTLHQHDSSLWTMLQMAQVG